MKYAAQKVLGLFCLFALGFGCSTAQVRVMPGENGVNKIVSRDRERDGAETAANKEALKYCEKQGKQAIFLSDDTKYTGSMDETTRNTVRKASRAATVLGRQDSFRKAEPGKLPERGTVETAGHAGTIMTNDRDYKTEVSFKCQ